MPKYADSHCHFSLMDSSDAVESIIAKAKSKNIFYFLQGGYSPEEWNKQLELLSKYNPHLLPVFGIHPMWIATQNHDVLEFALDQLSKLASKMKALGEIGFDLRPQYVMQNSTQFELQLEAVINQVELAKFTKLPLVWHLVRCFDEIKNNPARTDWFSHPGFIHGFNGSWTQAKFYLDHGLKLSFGFSVLNPKNTKIHEVLKKIPLESLLIETDLEDSSNPIATSNTSLNPTDYTDNTARNLSGQSSDNPDLISIAKCVADIKNLKAEKILEISTSNLFSILKI